MVQLFELVKRNLKIYLRDKSAVFFSLLSMLIVIGLMLFFLGDMNIEAITDMLGVLPDRDADTDKANAKLLVLMWTCAGIISINAVSVTLASLSPMIKDRADGRLNSIYTSPISRLTVSAGYVFAAWVSSVIICAITLAVCEIYCVISGAEPFSVKIHLELLGMICVNSFTYASLMYLLAMIAKTQGAWSGLGTIIGTLVGFVGGIYLPIGSIASGIASAIKCLPVIYGTSMFRQVMTDSIVEVTFTDAPAQMAEEYREIMGIELFVFDNEVSIGMCLMVLLGYGLIFLAAGAFITRFGKKTDR